MGVHPQPHSRSYIGDNLGVCYFKVDIFYSFIFQEKIIAPFILVNSASVMVPCSSMFLAKPWTQQSNSSLNTPPQQVCPPFQIELYIESKASLWTKIPTNQRKSEWLFLLFSFGQWFLLLNLYYLYILTSKGKTSIYRLDNLKDDLHNLIYIIIIIIIKR